MAHTLNLPKQICPFALLTPLNLQAVWRAGDRFNIQLG